MKRCVNGMQKSRISWIWFIMDEQDPGSWPKDLWMVWKFSDYHGNDLSVEWIDPGSHGSGPKGFSIVWPGVSWKP